MQGCKGAKLTAKKNKVTDRQADRQASGVTLSLLELLVAAKNMCVHVYACVCMYACLCVLVCVSVCVCLCVSVCLCLCVSVCV